MDADRRVAGVRVLQSFPEPRPTTNPYVVQLRDQLAALPEVEVVTFSWRRALLGRWDLLHAHWPEILVGGQSPLKASVRQLLFLLLMARMAVTGRPWVRTVHNLDLPSGIPRRARLLLRLADRRTALRILLNPHTPVPAGSQVAVVPHGHYRDWYGGHAAAAPHPGRIVFVGAVRRYKGVEDLLRAFAELDGDDVSVRVAGRPTSPELAAEVRAAAAADPRATLRLEHLDDDDLVAETTAAHVVALPHRGMHNSGSALLALSLGRPVLVPDNEVNRDLSAEVGPGWVHTYRGELTGDDLGAAARAAHPATPPDLSRRSWPESARAHADAYRRALGGPYSR
jgi:glycosyltransferase involved in cell wall biosynthesis